MGKFITKIRRIS